MIIAVALKKQDCYINLNINCYGYRLNQMCEGRTPILTIAIGALYLFCGVVSQAAVFVNSFCECCRLKDVTSLSCGWTAIRKVKISALRFLMPFVRL